jgi:hypothetical protein
MGQRAVLSAVFLSLCATAYANAVAGPPVPSADELDTARVAIRKAYADDYGRLPEGYQALVDKLDDSASQEPKATVRYALFVEAENVAARGGDYTRAMLLIDKRAEGFACDGIKEGITLLETAAKDKKVLKDESRLMELYRLANDIAYRALSRDLLAHASAATKAARSFARSLVTVGKDRKQQGLESDGNDKQKQVKRLEQTIENRKKRQSAFNKAKEALTQNPDDAETNLTVGRYTCFVLGQRDQGLPALAKSGQQGIADLAVEEIKFSNVGDRVSERYFELGSKWWSLAEKTAESNDELGDDIKKHAAALYEIALPGLQGVDQQVAIQRIKEASPQVGPGVPPKDFFKIHRLVSRKNAAEGWQALLKEIELIEDTGKQLQGGRASSSHPPADPAASQANAVLAFDGSEQTAHDTGHQPVESGHWIQYEMPYPVRLSAVRILQSGGGNHLYEVELQGSNDGDVWTTLDVFKDLPDDFRSPKYRKTPPMRP